MAKMEIFIKRDIQIDTYTVFIGQTIQYYLDVVVVGHSLSHVQLSANP